MKLQSQLCLFLSFLMVTPVSWGASRNTTAPIQGSQEFVTSNPKERLLVEVQVWGDVRSPGVYHVPDTTNLTKLISLSGGPKGDVEDLEVLVTRAPMAGKSLSKRFEGEEFITSPEANKWIMKNYDVVYIEATATSDSLLKNLSVVTAITGAITSVALVVFMYRSGENNNNND